LGVEGKDKAKVLEAGALALSYQLGRTVAKLRKDYGLSLADLSAQSGVAKSIISQIERNETNPTLTTIWRLAHALDVSIESVLHGAEEGPFIEHTSRGGTPILMSEDGLCKLAVIGWLNTVDWLQWYDFQAESGGVLGSEAHPRGSIECLSLLDGELEVAIGDFTETARAGETLRYRCDRPHQIRNLSAAPARATMVCILKAAAMD
jgi:transcriptional regulator with XRE-family HTH domain